MSPAECICRARRVSRLWGGLYVLSIKSFGFVISIQISWFDHVAFVVVFLNNFIGTLCSGQRLCGCVFAKVLDIQHQDIQTPTTTTTTTNSISENALTNIHLPPLPRISTTDPCYHSQPQHPHPSTHTTRNSHRPRPQARPHCPHT